MNLARPTLTNFRAILLTFVLFGLTSATAVAQLAIEPAKRSYGPQGTPVDPLVDARWNKFHDYQAATQLLQQLAKAHKEFAKLESLGKSAEERELWVMTITDPKSGKADEKPAFWIDSGIHANETQSVEVVLYTAWFLLEMREENEEIARLLRERTFYLMPMMSPDSRDAHFYEVNNTHSPRGGQIPVDDDLDGEKDEDGFDDLDGDGSVTQMRIADKNGKWKSHSKYPQWLVRVEPGEQGEYTLLGSEGLDNDGDGSVNEDGDGYYDPNRDWPWKWEPKYVQRGAEKYPLSVPENRLVAKFIASKKNIAGAQSYHNAGGMILYGPGVKGSKLPREDQEVYDRLGEVGVDLLPGYRYLNIGEELYPVWGGEVDWLHESQGVFCFTNELFTPFNFFRETEQEGFFGSEESRRKFDKFLLFGGGFTKWKKYQHPQYGEIEIGGVKKNWMRQSPGFLLEEECHRNMAFALFHADSMPQVEIRDISVKALAAGLFQVTAIVANPKLVPTHNVSDRKNRITRPNLVTIEGDDLEVVVALDSSDLLFRKSRPTKTKPATVKLDNLAGESVHYVRWLVQGKGDFEVTLDSVKGGRDSANGELP